MNNHKKKKTCQLIIADRSSIHNFYFTRFLFNFFKINISNLSIIFWILLASISTWRRSACLLLFLAGLIKLLRSSLPDRIQLGGCFLDGIQILALMGFLQRFQGLFNRFLLIGR